MVYLVLGLKLLVPAIFRSLTKTYTTASFVMYHRWLFVYFDIGHHGKIAKECEGFTDYFEEYDEQKMLCFIFAFHEIINRISKSQIIFAYNQDGTV